MEKIQNNPLAIQNLLRRKQNLPLDEDSLNTAIYPERDTIREWALELKNFMLTTDISFFKRDNDQAQMQKFAEELQAWENVLDGQKPGLELQESIKQIIRNLQEELNANLKKMRKAKQPDKLLDKKIRELTAEKDQWEKEFPLEENKQKGIDRKDSLLGHLLVQKHVYNIIIQLVNIRCSFLTNDEIDELVSMWSLKPVIDASQFVDDKVRVKKQTKNSSKKTRLSRKIPSDDDDDESGDYSSEVSDKETESDESSDEENDNDKSFVVDELESDEENGGAAFYNQVDAIMEDKKRKKLNKQYKRELRRLKIKKGKRKDRKKARRMARLKAKEAEEAKERKN